MKCNNKQTIDDSLVCGPWPLFSSISLIALLMVTGCAAPLGMHGHKPEILKKAACNEKFVQVDGANYRGVPIVLKRFDRSYKEPVGGNFVVGDKEHSSSCHENEEPFPRRSISQAYSSPVDLALPIYEATYKTLKKGGFPVWKDYDPSIFTIKKPPAAEEFIVIAANVTHLELDTYTDSEIKEAVAVKVEMTSFDRKSKVLQKHTIEKIAKGVRGLNEDILAQVGGQIAKELASQLLQGKMQ